MYSKKDKLCSNQNLTYGVKDNGVTITFLYFRGMVSEISSIDYKLFSI